MKKTKEFKGMYALLVAVATMIGITIYGSCSADEDYGNTSDYELKTNASQSMLLTEPPLPSYHRYTNTITNSHIFNFTDDYVCNANISYRIRADENLTDFIVDTISWIFTDTPLYPVEKSRRLFKLQSNGTIRLIVVFEIYRYDGISGHTPVDSRKDTLNLTASDFH